MQEGKIITLSVWLLIVFNIVLAFGAVWSLQRMSPAISRIYERNVKSLSACEDMLLALTGEKVNMDEFNRALSRADSNITEEGEEQAIKNIRQYIPGLADGSKGFRQLVTREVIALTNYNKKAILESARQTQKLRQAGAWGIVFASLLFFLVAIRQEQRLRRMLLLPLQEISDTVKAHMQGDKFRRCNLPHTSGDMKKLLESINSLLDKQG